jgi:hypothetical protein
MRCGVGILAAVFVATFGFAGAPATAVAQQKSPTPHALLEEHVTVQGHLKELANEPGAVGAAAKKILAVMLPHDQREEEFVFPLLGLVTDLAAGKANPDMAWALAMADRVKAEQKKLYQEHSAIIAAVNELAAAARARHDTNLEAFAEAVASSEVNDGEVEYPTAILVGMYLRTQLPAAK